MEKKEERRTTIPIVISAKGNREWLKEHNVSETDRLYQALWNLLVGLQAGDCSVNSFEVVQDLDTHDRLVKATFEGGTERWANITGDSVPCAIWDVMRQIPELQERG